ncbi:MAG: putative glycolipid-binding domain-containing protein [Alphaproteobacteria bacterium]
MRRDIVWERTGPMGLEHLTLESAADGIRADGLIVVDLGRDVVRLRYAVWLEPGWRTLSARITRDRGDAPIERRIDRIGDDRWTIDGQPRPDLDGCFDIDIQATPFTNAMPINRLGLAEGEGQRLAVVYVVMPDLAVRRAEQEYTLLAPGRLRYRGLGTDFEAEVTADADGLVIDYPPIWRRRSAHSGTSEG